MENNTLKVGSPLMYKMNLDLESPIKIPKYKTLYVWPVNVAYFYNDGYFLN